MGKVKYEIKVHGHAKDIEMVLGCYPGYNLVTALESSGMPRVQLFSPVQRTPHELCVPDGSIPFLANILWCLIKRASSKLYHSKNRSAYDYTRKMFHQRFTLHLVLS